MNEVNYSIAGRLMWEPEHYLSLGIESGYYRLYSLDVNSSDDSTSVHILNVAIPIQLVISMKFFENFYASFSFGRQSCFVQ